MHSESETNDSRRNFLLQGGVLIAAATVGGSAQLA